MDRVIGAEIVFIARVSIAFYSVLIYGFLFFVTKSLLLRRATSHWPTVTLRSIGLQGPITSASRSGFGNTLRSCRISFLRE
jgi:hypothetical protein